jgi:glycosyltransferase involved in cell wall biosynthesis
MTATTIQSTSKAVRVGDASSFRERAIVSAGERRRPRILMACARYLPLTGGVETHVHETARRLTDRGFRVGVLTTDATGDLARREEREGVAILRVPAWPRGSDVRFAPQVFGEIARGDWDLVHVQGYHTFVAPLAMVASIRAGLPFVVTFHSGGHSSSLRNAMRGAQRLALRPLVRSASQLIGVSCFEANFFSRAFGLAREKFQVVPNGGELPKPSPRAARRTTGRMIVSIGRLERYKGHQRAVEAMPHVLRWLPDARLHILGEGPYEPYLRRLVTRLGLDDRVAISAIPPGARQAMADLLASAALVVLFSDYEAHPVAVMEALALGRKVIVSDTSGFAEMIERGHVRGAPVAAQAEERAQVIVETMESGWIPPPIELPTWEGCVDRLAVIYWSVLGAEAAGAAA